MKLALLSLFALSTEQVVDTNNAPIFSSPMLYYIMPAVSGVARGGVIYDTTGYQTCPLTIMQQYFGIVKGFPVKFTKKQSIFPGVIFTETPLDISFQNKPDCAESSKWVVIYDFPTPYVAIGGAENHPGKMIMDGSFHIEKVGTSSYKFVFCPIISGRPGFCYDIGRSDDTNGRRLILTEKDAYEVVFENAHVVDEHYSIIA